MVNIDTILREMRKYSELANSYYQRNSSDSEIYIIPVEFSGKIEVPTGVLREVAEDLYGDKIDEEAEFYLDENKIRYAQLNEGVLSKITGNPAASSLEITRKDSGVMTYLLLTSLIPGQGTMHLYSSVNSKDIHPETIDDIIYKVYDGVMQILDLLSEYPSVYREVTSIIKTVEGPHRKEQIGYKHISDYLEDLDIIPRKIEYQKEQLIDPDLADTSLDAIFKDIQNKGRKIGENVYVISVDNEDRILATISSDLVKRTSIAYSGEVDIGEKMRYHMFFNLGVLNHPNRRKALINRVIELELPYNAEGIPYTAFTDEENFIEAEEKIYQTIPSLTVFDILKD